MPFTEEAPKSVCGCKNRTCPFQDLYVDNAHGGKKYLTYRCSKPHYWRTCLRWVDPKSSTAAGQLIQKPQPIPQTSKQEETRCNQYPFECWQCAPLKQDACGVENEYRKPPV